MNSFSRLLYSASIFGICLATACSSGVEGPGGKAGDGNTFNPAPGRDPGVPPTTPGGNASSNGGVGKVCAAASDCAAGLSCHTDMVDWIAHEQCTTSCQKDADCTASFGNHTMCIGAGICVAKCLDDSDCPSKTTCNENGWCAHTGPGSGVPACEGTPKSCALMTATECSTALGCTSSGSCSGEGQSCFSQFDSFGCGLVEGCYWDSSAQMCTGISRTCSSNFTQGSCDAQSGCSWQSSCSGTQTETSCSAISPSLCKYTVGCSLVPQ